MQNALLFSRHYNTIVYVCWKENVCYRLQTRNPQKPLAALRVKG